MFSVYIAIGTGGALGAICRYILGKLLPTAIFTHFPLTILLINAIGCFLLGSLVEIMALYWSPTVTMRYFLITGFLGGFTTFSAFTLEFALLVDQNLHIQAIFYAISSVIISIICFFIGISIIRLIKV